MIAVAPLVGFSNGAGVTCVACVATRTCDRDLSRPIYGRDTELRCTWCGELVSASRIRLPSRVDVRPDLAGAR